MSNFNNKSRENIIWFMNKGLRSAIFYIRALHYLRKIHTMLRLKKNSIWFMNQKKSSFRLGYPPHYF